MQKQLQSVHRIWSEGLSNQSSPSLGAPGLLIQRNGETLFFPLEDKDLPPDTTHEEFAGYLVDSNDTFEDTTQFVFASDVVAL